MKSGRLFTLFIACLALCLTSRADSPGSDYAVGADVSFLKQAEDRGTVFKDQGQPKPGLQIFEDHGYNWVRLRLFHTPDWLPNNLEYTLALATEAKKLGFKFLLDFHYSDTWADPGKQGLPRAWEGKSHAELVLAVADYTRDTIAAFRKFGVLPDMVQLGNEVIHGMLWPDGKLPENWDNFAELLKSAAKGLEAGCAEDPRPRIMVHIDRGGDVKGTRAFFSKLDSYHVAYDVIGQSYYPWWHGSLADLRENLAFMAKTYQKDIMVVEAAYNWRPAEYKNRKAPFPETPEGQREFLEEVNRAVLSTPNHRGKGIFWWEPAVAAGRNGRGMFDDGGNALPVITVFDGVSTPVLSTSLAFGAVVPTTFKFDFGPGKVAPGYIQIRPTTVYSKELGYGFDLDSKATAVDRGGDDPLRGDFCTSDRPFFFSVALPEGNYNVIVTLGDPAGESTTTIKAESRRLMLEQVQTATGKFVTRTFTINVRTPRIASGGQVKLKSRETGPPPVLHWDDKLTLEFNGTRPCVCALEITPADDAITVYLAGDSTVTDQPREPWNSWGQMLPRFFKPGVAIANHAESGESLPSFLGAKRLEKILSTMKAGDYLFIQFGHNDQKDKRPNAGPFTTYKTNLLRFVSEARQRGGIPVLVTPMERKAGVTTNTLGDFPAAVREVAKEQNVPLIDLHSMSRTLYAALGKDLGQAFQDGTHHNNYGSYELAKCVVEGIKANKLGLAKFLVDDVPAFDPAHPNPVESFKVPASPLRTTEKPEGN